MKDMEKAVQELRELRRMADELDTAALKKALPDLARQFTKQTTSRRFCIA